MFNIRPNQQPEMFANLRAALNCEVRLIKVLNMQYGGLEAEQLARKRKGEECSFIGHFSLFQFASKLHYSCSAVCSISFVARHLDPFVAIEHVRILAISGDQNTKTVKRNKKAATF